MSALASIEGSAPIRADPRSFVEAFRRRIEAGLLGGRPHPRSRYAITRIEAHELDFRAADWLTAINVGLNEVQLSASSRGVRYGIRYRRWASYVVGLCGTLGAALVVFFLAFDLRLYLERHPASAIPGLSAERNIVLAWTMALFWGFVWPWILIALHRRPLRRLIDRLVAEVDSEVLRAPARHG